MSNLYKKLALIILSSLLLFNSVMAAPLLALAQEEPEPPASSSTSSWYNQGFTDWYAKVYDTKNPSEIYGERYTAAQVEWIIYGLFAFILNHVSDQGTSVKCISGDAVACTDALKQTIEMIQGLIPQSYLQNKNQTLASLIFSNRGFSGIGYIKEQVEKFAIIPKVNAQTGFGFDALDPVRKMWSVFRNFAYALSVLVIIVFAFMIMFRVKISPQIVISVQSALPKIIAALIFVTFSYAIAGFMVDLMYVVIGLISLLISGTGSDPKNIFTIMTEGYSGVGFIGMMGVYFVLFMGVLLFNLFASGNPIVNVIPPIASILLVLFIIVVIVAAIMMFFMFFKIFWLLLKTIAQTYLLVIFAPIQIMLGSFNQNLGFGSWLKSLAANLAVYPVVGALFMFSQMFLIYSAYLGLGNLGSIMTSLSIFNNFPTSPPQWVPPLTLGVGYLPLVFTGISFVILTLIPKSVEIIQGFISGKPFAYGSAIGEAVGPALGLGKAGIAGGLNVLEDERRKRGKADPALITSIARAIGLYKT